MTACPHRGPPCWLLLLTPLRLAQPPRLQVIGQAPCLAVHLRQLAQPTVQHSVPGIGRRRPQRRIHRRLHLLLKHALNVLAQGSGGRGEHLRWVGHDALASGKAMQGLAGCDALRSLCCQSAQQQVKHNTAAAVDPASDLGVSLPSPSARAPPALHNPPSHLPCMPSPTCSMTTASSRSVDRMLLYRLLRPRSAARSAAASASRASSRPPAAAAAASCCCCCCCCAKASSRRLVNMGRVEM